MSNDSLDELLQDGFRYALSLTHDVTKAEDILQDAWVAVLNANISKPKQKKQNLYEKPYLFSAIRTRFINQYRREALVPISSLDTEFSELADFPDIAADSFSDRDIDKLLQQLRPVEREALYLSAVEGYTVKEISIQTDQPRGTVLSLIHRAKVKLKNTLHITQKEVSL